MVYPRRHKGAIFADDHAVIDNGGTPEQTRRQLDATLAAIRDLGLHAIPRGAGTGLTGGAIPLTPDCVMVNTEKLNRIRGVSTRPFVLDDGRTVEGHVLELEAGAAPRVVP